MSNDPNSQNQPAGGVGGGVDLTGVSSGPATAPILPIAGTVQAIRSAMSGVPGLVKLKSSAERRAIPKIPSGGEGFLPGLVEAVKAHPEALPPKVDLATIQADLQRAAELVPLKVELEADLRETEDSILVARGEAWKAMLAIYAQLQVLARHEPDLLGLVAQMEAFFAARVRKKAEGTGKKHGKVAKAAGPASSPAPEAPSAAPAGSDGMTVTTTTTVPPKP